MVTEAIENGQFRNGTRPWIIGHRGVSSSRKSSRYGSGHIENTLSAFSAAVEQGARGFELDVRRSSDDVLVVHHDAHLSDGRMVRDVLSKDLPDWVPTLADALELADSLECEAYPGSEEVGQKCWVNIEVKNHPTDPDYDAEHGISVAVAGLVAAFDMSSRVLVSSFDMDSIQRIHQTDPSIPIGWLVWGQSDPGQLIERAKAQYCASINPHDLLVDTSFVRRAREAGLKVYVWTVDAPERIRALAKMGVDGIITNTPEAAVQALIN